MNKNRLSRDEIHFKSSLSISDRPHNHSMHHTTFLDTLLTKIDPKPFENSYHRPAQSLLVNLEKLIQILSQIFSSPGGKEHFLQIIFWKTHPFFISKFQFSVIIYSWARLITGKFIHANSMRTGSIFVRLISGKLAQLWYLAWMSFPENSLCHVPKSYNQRLEAFSKNNSETQNLSHNSILTKLVLIKFSFLPWIWGLTIYPKLNFCPGMTPIGIKLTQFPSIFSGQGKETWPSPTCL